jgi:exopolysaccharide production protein ExoQ
METVFLEKQLANRVLKVLLLIFVFSLATSRATGFLGPRGVICDTDWLTTSAPCIWRNVSIELILWTLALVILALNLIFDHDFTGFYSTCKQNWLIFVFILLAFISLGWTIRFEITLYKSIILLLTSLMAIYIGHSFRLDHILKILVLYYVFLCTFNLLFVLFFNTLGIMPDPFYQGAWRGIFWHRNFLGCFMALGVTLFLVNLLAIKKIGGGDFYLNLLMLMLTSFLLIKSKNATGIITAIVLVGLVFILFFWVKWHQKMKPAHYYGFLAIAIAVVAFVLSKLEFFLGLLGRNTSLTGRVPMWGYLFKQIISQRPWLGYGYGAIWHMQGFLEELEGVFHWGVGMGDNGYIDILLHLGVIGMIILIIILVLGFIRGVKFFLQKRTLEAAFPILVLVFVIVANISISLILETETFVWMVALATLVSISPRFTTMAETTQTFQSSPRN